MPLFGVGQSGGNIVSGLNMTDLRSGDQLNLLTAADTTLATGSSSVAVVVGPRPGGGTVPKTFEMTGCTTTEWTVQASNGPATEDVPGSPTSPLTKFDATFLDTLGSDTTGNGAYTDTGASAYYRFHIKTLTNGDVPVGIVRIG